MRDYSKYEFSLSYANNSISFDWALKQMFKFHCVISVILHYKIMDMLDIHWIIDIIWEAIIFIFLF